MEYNLEEFKEWLATVPERGLGWWNSINTDIKLEKLIQGEDYYEQESLAHGFRSSPNWQPYREVVLKWKALKDQEREQSHSNEENAMIRFCNQCQQEQEHLTYKETPLCVKCYERKVVETLAGQEISQWKQKYQNLVQQRKTQITSELTLIKEILAHDQP